MYASNGNVDLDGEILDRALCESAYGFVQRRLEDAFERVSSGDAAAAMEPLAYGIDILEELRASLFMAKAGRS